MSNASNALLSVALGPGWESHSPCIRGTLPPCWQPRAALCHWERTDGRLATMLAPAIETIQSGLEAAGVLVRVAVLPAGTDAVILARVLAWLQRADTFMWVGPMPKHVSVWAASSWAELRDRGVRTVMYNTEPVLKLPPAPIPSPARGAQYLRVQPRWCMVSKVSSLVPPHVWPHVDELWDYSRANLQQCGRLPPAQPSKGGRLGGQAGWGRTEYVHLHRGVRVLKLSRAPVLRHVPPGFLASTAALLEKAGSRSSHAATNTSGSCLGAPCSLFLGDASLGERPACFRTLSGPLELEAGVPGNVAMRNDVFTPAALMALVNEWRHGRTMGSVNGDGRPLVVLNLHKHCQDHSGSIQPFETMRASQLLSVGALLVSQASHREDQTPYDGLVTFAPLPELRQALDDALASPGSAIDATRRAALFRERFQPAEILARAAGPFTPPPRPAARKADHADQGGVAHVAHAHAQHAHVHAHAHVAHTHPHEHEAARATTARARATPPLRPPRGSAGGASSGATTATRTRSARGKSSFTPKPATDLFSGRAGGRAGTRRVAARAATRSAHGKTSVAASVDPGSRGIPTLLLATQPRRARVVQK